MNFSLYLVGGSTVNTTIEEEKEWQEERDT